MGRLSRWASRAMVVAACLLVVGLAPAAAHAATTTTPPCQPTLHFGLIGEWCGWSVAPDPANPFLASFGQCTYWALERRPDIWTGRSATDTNTDWDGGTWADHARAEGLSVGSLPEVGTVAVWTPAQAGNPAGPGHVAYVEAVDPSGSIVVSEMNHVYGTSAGDTDVLFDTTPDQGGWRGLRFIHRRGASDAQAPSAVRVAPERVSVSPSVWTGGRYSVTVRLSGPGTIHADAARGSRDVLLRAVRHGQTINLTGPLSSGVWRLTIWAAAPRAAYPSVSPYYAVLTLR